MSELREYQKSDKDRRCLEYALYQTELTEVTGVLEKIEEERQTDVHDGNLKRKEFNQREAVVQVSRTVALHARLELTMFAAS